MSQTAPATSSFSGASRGTARRSALLPNFDARSALLFTALAVGAACSQAGTSTFGPGPATSAPTATTGPSLSAGPATSPKDVEAVFNRSDRNKDGKLSQTEARALPVVAGRFTQFDKDHDQHLSRAEFQAAVIGS